MRADIETILQVGGGAIRRRDYPELGQRLDRLRQRGELVSILPGVLIPATAQGDWRVRVRAGALWAGPDAVLTRFAAARLTFWPDCAAEEISFAIPGGQHRPQPGWPVQRALIPPEMIRQRGKLRFTGAAYTAVELAAEASGDVIDRALRAGVKLTDLWGALAAMSGRAGNQVRRQLLHDSRDEPWSELERKGHRLLRQHRISGWVTNAWVPTAKDGYVVDLLFRRERVIVEFDGYGFHSDREAFERDRARRNELVLAGYIVLNFTWAQLIDRPDWVISCIRRALAAR